MKKPLLVAALLVSALPSVAASQRAIWKLPKDANYQTLLLRPDGKIGIYWESGTDYVGVTTHGGLIDEKSGHVINTNYLGIISSGMTEGTDIIREALNSRGQHAYLPYQKENNFGFLRLKIGEKYKVLNFIPLGSRIEDLKFSPDGEVLKVLGEDRLWVVGAQTGKLLRVIYPKRGKWWSRENAVLSPDGFKILGMQDKMTVFSAQSGLVLNTYGVYLQSLIGSCGSVEHHISFSADGKSTYAFQDCMNTAGTTYEYSAMSGNLIRKQRGSTPDDSHTSLDGRFYLDYVRTPNDQDFYPIVKSVQTRHTVATFPEIRFNDPYNNPVIFSSDGKSIYWVDNNILWQRPIKFS